MYIHFYCYKNTGIFEYDYYETLQNIALSVKFKRKVMFKIPNPHPSLFQSGNICYSN